MTVSTQYISNNYNTLVDIEVYHVEKRFELYPHMYIIDAFDNIYELKYELKDVVLHTELRVAPLYQSTYDECWEGDPDDVYVFMYRKGLSYTLLHRDFMATFKFIDDDEQVRYFLFDGNNDVPYVSIITNKIRIYFVDCKDELRVYNYKEHGNYDDPQTQLEAKKLHNALWSKQYNKTLDNVIAIKYDSVCKYSDL